jgi:alkylation response protein AidB-like acyl-CoA dehydrogenase
MTQFLESSGVQPHPGTILSSEAVDIIRRYEAQAEQERQLPQAILGLIYEQQWLKVLVPQSAGGLEKPLPGVVRLFEALAWAGGNTGWCVNLGAGANMFAGYLDQATSLAIFDTATTWCAGSGAISGRATRVAGGYMLSGHWKYASGANHATHFTANAYIDLTEDHEGLTPTAAPFRSFIVPADKVHNHRNWQATGMQATSSNDFEIIDVFVPEQHTFSLLQPSDFATNALYRFPFEAMAVINMTCMITGLAFHFADEYRRLAMNKKPAHQELKLEAHPAAAAIYKKVSAHFNEARNKMYHALDQLWIVYESGQTADKSELEQFIQTCKNASAASRQLINELYPLCGMSVLNGEAPLNKIWRDAMTASQHYLLSPL